mgnify:CR=1 FL=1|jgi:Transcriptional regulators containing a DNA-binding HTH domain and an aminotransferase domain (MocR family) and their eukaryotic orthologs
MFPLPQLEPRSEEPLYRQLFEHIRAAILSGRLERGERLPATRELAGLLGLNRATVSAAYELLEQEGLVKGHVGRGSFVNGGPSRVSGLDWSNLLRSSASSPSVPLSISESAISFATSRPSEQLFPLEEFRASCEEVIASAGASEILQLGSPSGYAPLRRYLLEEAREAGIARDGDDLQVTNGVQQALDLIQRVLAPSGETVLVEDPVYPGLKNLLTRGGARLVGVPMGEEGVDLDALELALHREKPRLVILTPNFQNPTGATLSLSARLKILRMVRDARAVLVENDTYGELRYHGEPLPSIKQLDESGDTILLKSFSKIAFPGLRVGWVTGPKPLIVRLAEAKQSSDLHTDQLSQAVLLRFAESGRLAAHRARVLKAGADRLAAVISACESKLPAGSSFTRPQGGMNLWVKLPEPLDAGDLLARAHRENVSYLPGKFFSVSRHEPGTLRLSFAGLTPEKIRQGVAVLGQIFASELERARAARDEAPASALV